jgi:hypothetical protein
MQRIFENTERNAFLSKGIFPKKELLKECMLYVQTQLIEKP